MMQSFYCSVLSNNVRFNLMSVLLWKGMVYEKLGIWALYGNIDFFSATEVIPQLNPYKSTPHILGKL